MFFNVLNLEYLLFQQDIERFSYYMRSKISAWKAHRSNKIKMVSFVFEMQTRLLDVRTMWKDFIRESF